MSVGTDFLLLTAAEAAAALRAPGIRRDGYGTELEAAYPGVAVRLAADGVRYLVTRDRDRTTVRCTGGDVRGVCAGLTGTLDGRLDAHARHIAARLLAADAARWGVPLIVDAAPADTLLDDQPTIRGQVVH